MRKSLGRQAETGGTTLTSMGNDKPYLSIFDHLVLDAGQVTNPSIDPLREPMELRTYLGGKPSLVEVETDSSAMTRKPTSGPCGREKAAGGACDVMVRP